MTTTFICGHCGHRFEVPDGDAALILAGHMAIHAGQICGWRKVTGLPYIE